MEQLIFQKDYVAELKKSVKEGKIESYGPNEFIYNKDAAFSININRDDALLENMLKHATPGEDYGAA